MTEMQQEALFYHYNSSSNKIECHLCPHQCSISNGKYGFCQVRKNQDNKLILPFYGKLSALSVDPMEKKPLYHFFPGEKILSAGFWGCNLRCPFCQNYHISQITDSRSTHQYMPDDIIQTCLDQNIAFLAFTYSEPVVHYEWILQTAQICQENNIKTVLVTNGQLNKIPAQELLPFIDAVNVDLKAFQNEFYKSELKGFEKTTLDFIEMASKFCHLEVTTLVIPGKNDSASAMENQARYLMETAGKNTVLHLSAYYPNYRYKIPATQKDRIILLKKYAEKYLNFVYTGNIPGANSTLCPECRTEIIRRDNYFVKWLTDKKFNCPNCGFKTAKYIHFSH